LRGSRGDRAGRDAVAVTKPTHATIATFHMDLDREAEQRAGLEQMIVPGVRNAPGVITGHWTLDRSTAESIVLITYDSSTAAEDMAANIRANADNQRTVGIDLVSVRIVEVVATA
jgi:hypothetical protein